VILLRGAEQRFEVLLVQRAKSLAFHGGEWVFPGGRVDPVDGADPFSLPAARAAAVREAEEEAGVQLAQEALVPYAHWTTPEGRPRRFSTWFFLAAFDTGEVRVDGGEIHDHRWLTPRAALVGQERGELGLPPPTYVTLAHLAEAPDRQSVLHEARTRTPPVYVPRPRSHGGRILSLYAGDVAYDGGDPDAPGPRHRLVMVPGAYRYER
jgi:8-oxo-dGTP pyrophosphatase MutT (NUDIX family)